MVTTLTNYDKTFHVPVAFDPSLPQLTVDRIIAAAPATAAMLKLLALMMPP